MHQPTLELGLPKDEKTLGAYYTDKEVARFLVNWAVRSASDVVMDPAFGQGVFLDSAAQRIETLGGVAGRQIHGIEIDERTYERSLTTLSQQFRLTPATLRRCDFFELQPGSVAADAIVGNPPFIRYQSFTGSTRKRALHRAASQGVKLSGLTSSWAPFLVHAISMVKTGGRLAMVVPFELTHAAYAKPLLTYLSSQFGRITVLTFRHKLFKTLSQDTALLLADCRNSRSTGFFWRDLRGVQDLTSLTDPNVPPTIPHARSLNFEELCRGNRRLIEYLIPERALSMYRSLSNLTQVKRLGLLAYVGIGYVTGANDFFHLTPAEAAGLEIPDEFLRPAVRRGRIFAGLQFTANDWLRGLPSKDTGYLLAIAPDMRVETSVTRYLEQGIAHGIDKTYKCRTRSPWYSVPNVMSPDGFLTYMSGTHPKLVANAAQAVAPNTLHIVRIHPETSLTQNVLAALWQNSLTALSAELEGHAMGGGMLKMEPSEARNVLIPMVDIPNPSEFCRELDKISRAGRIGDVRELADEHILRRGLGLSVSDCKLARRATETLFQRRYSRGRKQSNVT